ncbi:MAG: LLM class flavin-dependent oxidoreductase [Acidobacteria bacterium]|nr:LLM class flavin-dependent oxidoreductase [Acidobacteriota bacterium]
MQLSVVILPCARWPEARAQWIAADEWGLHAGYTYDHLSWRSFRDAAWFSMVPTLTAAATMTSTLRLGPLVTSANFRHPLVLAKDLIAIDDISLGRLNVGIGAGGTGFDATTLGHEPWSRAERHERFVEFATAVERLLREPSSTLNGRYYPVVDSRQIPGPRQLPRPPIFLSALGPKSMELTAEMADGWVSFADASRSSDTSTYEVMAAQVASMNSALARRERDPGSLHRVLLHFEGDETPLHSYEAFLDWAGRYRELGFDEVVIHWPVPDSPFAADQSLFERICRDGRAVLATW